MIVENASKFPSKAVVVTGGEPSMYNMDYITKQFKSKGIQTFIETSGAYLLTGVWDWVCLSPKKTSAPLPENFAKADELKIIIHNKNDFEWAEKNAQHVSPDCKLLQRRMLSVTVMMQN